MDGRGLGEGGRWPERRQSFSFFPDSIRALWVIASRTDVSVGSLHVRERRAESKLREKVKLNRKVKKKKTSDDVLTF